MKRTTLISLILIVFSLNLSAQESSKDRGLKTITPGSIQGPLEFLASDWMMGRETGTRGEFMASDYIASMYKTIGLKPGGNPNSLNPGYFQNINFIQTRPGSRQECAIVRKGEGTRYQVDLVYKQDYSIAPGSQSIETEAQVVFVGFGIDDKNLKQNDFKGLNVKGKILLRLSGFPGMLNKESSNYKRFYSTDPATMSQLNQNKDKAALEHGAIAIIEISGGTTGFTQTPDNLPFRYNSDTYEGDVPFNTEVAYRTELPGPKTQGLTRILLSDRALNMLIEGSGLDFTSYVEKSGEENLKPVQLPADRYLHFVSTVDSKIVRGRNVIGILEGKDKTKCIVVGAHYDHMGEMKGYIFNGSDDNASGTVGVINIARAMVASGQKPAVTVVFCAWTAEEKGLLGSAWFVGHPYMKDIRCYMNYDMISRTAPDDSTGMKCDFNSSSGMPYLQEITEKHIRDYGIKLTMDYKSSPKPVGGSDFSSFSAKDIPIFLIHGKFTPDYHKYTDHAEKAVIPYMREIVRLGYLNIYELANRNW